MVQDHRARQLGPGLVRSALSFTSERRWRDQHCATRKGPRSPCRHVPEGCGVHQPHARGQGVDAERRPGQVQEREGGQHGHRRPGRRPEQLDAALGHQGEPVTAYTTGTGAASDAAATSSSTMAAYTSSKVAADS